MPFKIALPALSSGMEDATIARWMKVEGDLVSRGDILAEVETDKATMELEAEADGKLIRVSVPNGGRAKVGEIIAEIAVSGETSEASESTPTPITEQQSGETLSLSDKSAKPGVEEKRDEDKQSRRKASPLARRMASERGLDLRDVVGTGPGGRIVRLDVEKAMKVLASDQTELSTDTKSISSERVQEPRVPFGIGEYDEVPHTTMRRTIAKRLLEAKTTVPHFYLTIDCNVDALLSLRSTVNQNRGANERVSVNDFVIKAVAVALKATPDANVIWTDEAALRLRSVNISVAVSTDGGLVTPIIREADKKSLGTVSSEMKALASRARENRLRPEDYQGGGFTISNLGMYGIESFAAIINPPQSGILAVGAAERRPVASEDGVSVSTMMKCTLAVDHRSIDGALAAQLLSSFKASIESPMSILV